MVSADISSIRPYHSVSQVDAIDIATHLHYVRGARCATARICCSALRVLHLSWKRLRSACLSSLERLCCVVQLRLQALFCAAQAETPPVLHQRDIQRLVRLKVSEAIGCTRLLASDRQIGCGGCALLLLMHLILDKSHSLRRCNHMMLRVFCS